MALAGHPRPCETRLLNVQVERSIHDPDGVSDSQVGRSEVLTDFQRRHLKDDGRKRIWKKIMVKRIIENKQSAQTNIHIYTCNCTWGWFWLHKKTWHATLRSWVLYLKFPTHEEMYSGDPGQKKEPSSRFAARRTLFHVWYHARSRAISTGQGPISDCPRLLPCADRSWLSMISHVEQRSSRRESRGWFFFLSRVVLVWLYRLS